MGIWCAILGRHDLKQPNEAGGSIERIAKDRIRLTLGCPHGEFKSVGEHDIPSWGVDPPIDPPPPPVKPIKVHPKNMKADFLKVGVGSDGGFNFTGHLPILPVEQQIAIFSLHQRRGYNTLVFAAANSRGNDLKSDWPAYSFFDEPENLIPQLECAHIAGFAVGLFLMTGGHRPLMLVEHTERLKIFKRGLDLWAPYLSWICPSYESDDWDTKEDLRWMVGKLVNRYPELPCCVHFTAAFPEVQLGGWGYAYFKAFTDAKILLLQQTAYTVREDPDTGELIEFRRGPGNVQHNVNIMAQRCREDGRVFVGFENTPDIEASEDFAHELADASNKALKGLGMPIAFGNGAGSKWTK